VPGGNGDRFGGPITSHAGSADITYAYNSAGLRVMQTTVQGTTYFLIDPANPTGYAKAVEERTDANADGQAETVATAYVLGMQVIAQKSGSDLLLLAHDGHGSTRLLLTVEGLIDQHFDYDAFGKLLNMAASLAKTSWLFGGDGMADKHSGLTYHLARWRDGARFVSRDPLETAGATDPMVLHKYLYANGNPIRLADPSGHLGLVETLTTNAVQAFLWAWLALTTFNTLRAAHAADKPVDPTDYNPGGKWIATATGVSIGFGIGSVSGQLQVYHGVGSGAEVAGLAVGFSVNLPGVRTFAEYIKDLGSYSRLLVAQLSDPAQSVAASRDLVAASLRGWADQMGGDIRVNLGFAISATIGGGMVFNAYEAQNLVGLFVGLQAGYEANIEGFRTGISADALWGYSFHQLDFTRAYEVDAGLSMGLGSWGYGGGAGVQIVGTFFIPVKGNMPGWANYI
jgi:RHS repeat-associated protein